jgi:hypothetical protein
MTDRPTNDEREALIAGDRADALASEEVAELALLADLLADESTWAEPDPVLEEAVVRAVADATPAASVPRSPATARARGVSAPSRWRVVAWAAAAAAAAIVVATLALSGGGTSNDYAARLGATGVAPGARASADIVRTRAGFRITLDAHGLPPLRDGEFYQAWLKNAAGTLVPVGTFSSSDARVTLWSGVSPKDFPTITVTIEAADNEQMSSGRRVLVGEIRPT